MKKISLSRLEHFLKSQCDALRGAGLDASEYKDYIVAMIFLKRVNDQFARTQETYHSRLQTDHPALSLHEVSNEVEINNAAVYEFFVPVRARWSLGALPTSYDQEQSARLEDAVKHLANTSLDDASRSGWQKIKQEATENLQWRGLALVNENVGDALSIALNALEASNAHVLGGVLSTTKFNAINTKGDKILSDEVLTQMIRDFNGITLTDDAFEFPDLLGAAYEYLIKYFAESAGKKGGEFYTPSQVVELMGKILQPTQDAEICDPTVGSGGLLIHLRNYVEARYGTARHLTIHGQELKDGTYKMCRMNMIFHGIRNANIQQGDTLLDPRLVENGQLRKYDIVVANPPFSQNYTTEKMTFKERFLNWTSKKKQADFMFVQHMIAILKNSGRMAVVMPHGVLFRGGEEQRIRKRLIEAGILECVIGLPEALFYGTTIPASILIINKANADSRDGVFFINADGDYREGKNQNILRPEDVEKIAHVYTTKTQLKKYSRLVSRAELRAEDYNCNIRRYVDNAPDPENHDVPAHLAGGLPAIEVDASLDGHFICYPELKPLFVRPLKAGYYTFTEAVTSKAVIKELLLSSPGFSRVRGDYVTHIDSFWKHILPRLETLPDQKDIFALSKEMSELIIAALAKQPCPLLDAYQSRGAFAQYLSDLQSDLKSVAASGWNAELIPDEEILESQFPQVLAELREKQSRREEIQSLFDEVAALEEGAWNEEDYEVIPKDQIKTIKDEIKSARATRKELEKEVKTLEKRIKACLRTKASDEVATLEIRKAQCEAEMKPHDIIIAEAEARIARHVELEDELRTCGVTIRTIERKKDDLVDQSRLKISDDEARRLILARWHRMLHATLAVYLDAHARELQQALEHLDDKYTVTLADILVKREEATASLNTYIKELGYA